MEVYINMYFMGMKGCSAVLMLGIASGSAGRLNVGVVGGFTVDVSFGCGPGTCMGSMFDGMTPSSARLISGQSSWPAVNYTRPGQCLECRK